MPTINLAGLKNVNLKGQGGGEKKLLNIFQISKGWRRTSNSLYDFENSISHQKVEIKKQKNQQWIDPSKYSNLTDTQKKILMIFLQIDDDGDVEAAHAVSTENLVDRLWDSDTMEAAHKLKQVCPQVQVKYPIMVKKFFSTHTDISKTVYKKGSSYVAGDTVYDTLQEETVKIVSIHAETIPALYTVVDICDNEYILSEDDIKEFE
jgi:hypothetical protein